MSFKMSFKFIAVLTGCFFLFSQPVFALNEGEAAYNAGIKAYNNKDFQKAVFAFEKDASLAAAPEMNAWINKCINKIAEYV